jgi:hypothetical protein
MSKHITVAELPPFERWANKTMDDVEREALTDYLALNPTEGDVIKGGGGIRKLRWSRPGSGKSGGVRVIYYFYDETIPLYLITGYAKNVKDNLSDAELTIFRGLADRIKAKTKARRR